MSLSSESATLAQMLINGARKTFANAEALFAEATILANAAAWSRALFLHQISLEECAKIEMLGGAVTSLLMGEAIDLTVLRRAFSRHESKNKMNAYFLPTTNAEFAAMEEGKFDEAFNSFKELQEAFHKDSNADKNAALYVDFKTAFTSPSELVTEEIFITVRERNQEFMSMSCLKVEMLSRWASDLNEAASKVKELVGLLDLSTAARAEKGEAPL